MVEDDYDATFVPDLDYILHGKLSCEVCEELLPISAYPDMSMICRGCLVEAGNRYVSSREQQLSRHEVAFAALPTDLRLPLEEELEDNAAFAAEMDAMGMLVLDAEGIDVNSLTDEDTLKAYEAFRKDRRREVEYDDDDK